MLEKKLIMAEQVNSAVNAKYEEITSQFENLVKALSEKLNTLSTHDNRAKDELKKIKKDLDDKLNFLSNPTIFKKDFEEYLTKFGKKIRSLKVEDILNQKFNFTYKMSNCSLDWETFNGPVINVTPRGSSYWCVRSAEMLEGPFQCKILIKNLNSSNVSSYWSYTVGLSRPTISSESSYYNDCVLLQSNGYIASQYSGSGSHKQLFFTNWKTGDEILVKRDDQGRVYFGINSESSYLIGFEGIFGPMKLVMGFSTSVNGDAFELLEMTKE